MIDQEQRCNHYNNQGKKEGYPDSICLVYLIVGNPTEEQSRQTCLTLMRHERPHLITFNQNLEN